MQIGFVGGVWKGVQDRAFRLADIREHFCCLITVGGDNDMIECVLPVVTVGQLDPVAKAADGFYARIDLNIVFESGRKFFDIAFAAAFYAPPLRTVF